MSIHQKAILFLSLLVLGISCNSASIETDKNIISNQPAAITQLPSNNKTNMNSVKSISNSKELQPEDINIDIKISGVSSIEKKVLPPEVLENEGDKGGFLHPRCIVINFKGDYGKDSSWVPAHIMVCPVDEYKKIFTQPPSSVNTLEDKLLALNRILVTKPTRISPDFPSFVFFDASPSFAVNLNYISFKNGEGFFVMTQYTMEPTVINNRELKYLYQGFTTNKKYYILGMFPVKSKHLPDDDSDLEKLRELNKDGDLYDEYILNVKKKLKDKTSFTPKLEEIEETIKSLEIKEP